MEVTLFRTYSPMQTLGVLTVDGRVLCNTLELAWRDNQRQISCIPEGSYRVIKRGALPHRPYEHFYVLQVLRRSHILIHAGNYSRQILGCILVGDRHVDLDQDGLLDVANSRATLEMLCRVLPPTFMLHIIRASDDLPRGA
jgi:hypothetical protein